MRNLTLKTVCDGSGALPRTTIAHPMAPLGDSHDCAIQIRRVTQIPDDVDNITVVRTFERTVDLRGRLELRWDELGEGVILR